MDEVTVRVLDASMPQFDAQLRDLTRRQTRDDPAITESVNRILARVRAEGDTAIIAFTREYDRMDVHSVSELEVPAARLQNALADIAPEARAALEQAHHRILSYHQRQRLDSWDYVENDGTRLGQRVTPIERVGLYVPGGKAAYPSSVLMNAVPARVAGVSELIMTVPTPDGDVNELVYAAAALGGVDRVFRIGGAQAIAALAFGTATVPRVDKIVGPGNAYVAAAKKSVFGEVGIDMIAGPSEVVVVTDGSVDPDWVAMDLFAQAEHDELAQSILICTDPAFVRAVDAAIRRLLPTLERATIVARALRDHGALIQVPDLQVAAEVVDRIAPEHLELLVEDPGSLLDRIKHAGAIFMGAYSAEAMGDYCAGPNHVLPTSGTARFSSPLGVYDFQKRTSIIQCSAQGAAKLAAVASTLSRAESLTAHARSAEYRMAGHKKARE